MLRHLTYTISRTRLTPAERVRRSARISRNLMQNSSLVDGCNFDRIGVDDLQFLFRAIDREFFRGRVVGYLHDQRLPLRFRLSTRMTSSGGMTISTLPKGQPRPTSFEIVISSTLLFESFRDQQPILVTGLVCENRLQALQRIMEHEMIHLVEMLIWNRSSCSARRFRGIAQRLFGHRQSTHQLLTPADTARTRHNIVVGDWVSFMVEKQRQLGVVNQITRRATVLVPDRDGQHYSDGKHYRKFYVPIAKLTKA